MIFGIDVALQNYMAQQSKIIIILEVKIIMLKPHDSALKQRLRKNKLIPKTFKISKPDLALVLFNIF